MFENKTKSQKPALEGFNQGSKVKVIMNGKEKIISENTTVGELLEELNIKPQGIAFELNLEIVPKSRYVETVLKGGDKVEIVQMVGGG